METCSKCKCNLQVKLNEVTRINYIWQKDYTTVSVEMNNTKIRLRELEKQFEVANSLNAVLRTENLEMRTYIERSNEKLSNNSSNKEYQNNFKDELEILKQQVNIYKEDFEKEQKEKIELEVKLKAIKKDLTTSLKTIDKTKEEIDGLRKNYQRTRSEKEYILSELKRLSSCRLEDKTFFQKELVERD